MEKQVFNGRDDYAPVGIDVYYYPRAQIEGNTIPRVAKIRYGHQNGAADLSILPTCDGAVDAKDYIWHSSDVRVHDSNGNISTGAERNGCWEFTPWAWEHIVRMRQARRPQEIPAMTNGKPVSRLTDAKKTETKEVGV